MMSNETKGMLLGLVGVTAFGLTLPATRVVIPYLDVFFISFGRGLLAAICAGLLLIYYRCAIPTKQQCYQLIIVALGVVLGFPMFLSWALQYIPAAHGGVVLGILPLATAMAGAWLNKEKPSLRFWIVGVFGSLLVVTYTMLESWVMYGNITLHIADIALLGAVISAAIGYAAGAKLSQQLGGWQVICWALIISLPVITPFAIFFAPDSWSHMPPLAIACFLYLGLVSQLAGFFVWYKGLAMGGIARVSQVQLLQPVITLIASAFLIHEDINTLTVLFVILVVATVWLSRKMPITLENKLTKTR